MAHSLFWDCHNVIPLSRKNKARDTELKAKRGGQHSANSAWVEAVLLARAKKGNDIYLSFLPSNIV